MSEEFTLTGSEPVEFTMGLTMTDPEAFERIFGPVDAPRMRIKGMTPIHPCPVCGELIDGGLVSDITVTPGDRPDTYTVHGKSVTYTPCGHEVRMEANEEQGA